MPNYSKMTDKVNNRKIQVESAVRDGEGNKISTRYITSDGYYPQLGAGFADLADNLTPYSDNSAISQDTSFNFQTSAGGSDIGSYSLLKELRGNTVIWNQLYRTTDAESTTIDGITFSRNATTGVISVSGTCSASSNISISLIASIVAVPTNQAHKYLVKWNLTGTAPDINVAWSNLFSRKTSIDVDDIYYGGSNNSTYVQITIAPNAQVNFTIRPQIFDLTDMFGAGNEPTSVVEFNRLFPLPYYDFNVGQLSSSKSNKLINVGFNAFDIDNPTDFIKVITGETYSIENTSGGSISEYDGSQTLIKTTNVSSLSVAESGTPYIVLTDNTHYVKINDYTSTTCLHLTWGNERDGEFEEYVKYEYDLPDVELRSAGSVYDVIYSSGNGKRRIEYVNIIDLINGQYQLRDCDNGSGKFLSFSYNYGYLTGTKLPKKATSSTTKGNILCNLGDNISENAFYNQQHGTDGRTMDVCYILGSHGGISFMSHGLDNLSTKQDLIDYFTSNPCYIQYELETEQDITSDSWVERQDINDFGTQEFVSSQAIQVPQGNLFSYPVDYKAFVDSLGSREDIDYDASQVVSHEELTEALSHIDLSGYVTTDNTGIIKYLDAPNSGAPSDLLTYLESGAICYVNGNVNNSNPPFKYGSLWLPTKGTTGEDWGIGYYFNQANHERMTIFQYRGNGISDYNWIKLANIESINGIYIEQYYKKPQASVSLSDGGTITDNALKRLIQNEQPIKLNGFTCYFSCDDGTNYQYVSTRYDSGANKNHINVITINKSTWVATFHTSDLALS